MRQWIGSALLHVMAWRRAGAKPLLEPMLTYCQLGPFKTNFNEILIEIQTCSFMKMHLKMSSAKCPPFCPGSLQWRHNERGGGVSNHQVCLLNRLFRCRSKKTTKLCVTGLCAGNSPVTGEFPSQKTSYAKNVSIWWRHHGEVLVVS